MMRQVFVASVVLAAAGAAQAHHSFAMFDDARQLTLRGTVKDFRWSNPHVFIQLLVSRERGIEEWSVEMTSPEHLWRVGWKPRTLKSGDKITLIVHPMRDGSRGGQYLSGIGPDGTPIGSASPVRVPERRGAPK